MKRAELFWVGVILVFALALRVVSLNADPPHWLSWSAGIYSDEGIYSEDARLLVLYHQHMQGDFHAGVVAPLHNLMMIGVFELVKSSLKTVRIVSVLFSIGTLIAFWALMRELFGPKTAMAALLILATAAPYLFYNRLGLLETPALFWLVLGYLCLSKSGDKTGPSTRMLILAGVFTGIAVAWKATFVLGATALLCAAWTIHGRQSLKAALPFVAVLVIYAAAFIAPNFAEYSRDSHYYVTHQYLPHSLTGLWFDIHRGLLTGENDGELPYLFARLSLPVLLAFGYFLLRKPSRPTLNEMALILWVAIPLIAFLFCNYTPSRYLLMVLPPIAALAALGLGSLRNSTVSNALLTATICVNLLFFGLFWTHRTYTVHNSASIMQHVLPHDTWIAGQFGPELCLDNSLRSMYVQKGLANDTPDTLTVLPITHVLATQTISLSDDPWRGEYSQLVPGPGGLKSLQVGPYRVNVYANLNALP